LIIIIARLQCKPGTENDFITAANEVVAKTLEEPGCLAYSCLRDVADGSKFTFIEEWADRDALKEHFGAEHLRLFGEKAAHAFLQNPEIVMHTVEKSRALS
jgi:quinol monooxygenase YgiN